jgi:hypothetical protein
VHPMYMRDGGQRLGLFRIFNVSMRGSCSIFGNHCTTSQLGKGTTYDMISANGD